jgi:hypothetical protein
MGRCPNSEPEPGNPFLLPDIDWRVQVPTNLEDSFRRFLDVIAIRREKISLWMVRNNRPLLRRYAFR